MRIIATLVVGAICWGAVAQSSSKKIQKKVQISGGKTQSASKRASDKQSANYTWVKEVAQKYSPVTWNMLELYRQLPDKIATQTTGGTSSTDTKSVGTYQFLEGETKTQLLQSMATNVHEVSHAYYRFNALNYAAKNKLLVDWNNAEGYIYVSSAQTFYVSFPKARLIQSKDLASVIPSNLRTLRYSTYITGNTSTQSHGVIGLLNEFHAYYLGAKFSYDMMEAYCQAGSTAANGFLTWVQNTQSLMDAYYEFDFFIREYLLYMSQNHPKSYAQLKAYSTFWQAFNAVDQAFGSLNDQYKQTIRTQIAVVNKQGKSKLAIEDNMLWLDNGSGKRKGVSLKLAAKSKLSERLAELRD